MVDPGTATIAAAGIGAATSLAGGFLGDDGSKEAADNQVRFAKKAIRWRVRDAKAAGLHPLYALGASTNAFSPSFIGGQSPQGTAIAEAGREISRGVKNYPLAASQANALNASANRDEAAATLDLSRAKEIQRRINETQDGPDFANPVPTGIVKPMPSEVISSKPGKPGVQAGQKPFFMEVVIATNPDGSKKTIMVPASDEMSEAFENAGGIGMSALKNMGFLDNNLLDVYKNYVDRRVKLYYGTYKRWYKEAVKFIGSKEKYR